MRVPRCLLALAPSWALQRVVCLRVRHRRGSIRFLNRLILENFELLSTDGTLVLSRDDRRTKHVREQIWRKRTSDTLRIGVVNGGIVDACRARLTPDGCLILDINPKVRAALDVPGQRARLDVILALPAPLRLKRMLPVVSSMGVDTMNYSGARDRNPPDENLDLLLLAQMASWHPTRRPLLLW